MSGFQVFFAQAASAPAAPAAPAVQTTAVTQASATVPGTTAAPQQQANPLISFIPILLVIALFYFLMIRPQNKQRKEHENLLAQLKAGDHVVTSSGIYGTIVSVSEKTLMLRVAETAVVEIARPAVVGKVDEKK